MKVVSKIYNQKRRITIKKRVKKVRPEGYDPEEKQKRRNMSKSFETEELNSPGAGLKAARDKEREKKKVIYENMFKNFSANYIKTLDDMIDNSKHYYSKKARERQVLHSNAPVPLDQVVMGRRPNHRLIKAKIDEAAYSRHLKIFMAEL